MLIRSISTKQYEGMAAVWVSICLAVISNAVIEGVVMCIGVSISHPQKGRWINSKQECIQNSMGLKNIRKFGNVMCII